jgi:hypothetical protein
VQGIGGAEEVAGGIRRAFGESGHDSADGELAGESKSAVARVLSKRFVVRKLVLAPWQKRLSRSLFPQCPRKAVNPLSERAQQVPPRGFEPRFPP